MTDAPLLPASKRRILILDPNAAFAMKMRFALQREYGAAVIVEAVSDGESALKQLATHTFDLIVAEVVLARGDAFALLENVWQLAPRTRILVTSEFFALADIERTFSDRMPLTCVRKPIQPDALAALVIRWLEGKVSQAANEQLFDLIQLIRLERISCSLSISGARDSMSVGGRLMFQDGECISQSCWSGTREISLDHLMKHPHLRFTVTPPGSAQPNAPILDTQDLMRRSLKRTTRIMPNRIGLSGGQNRG